MQIWWKYVNANSLESSKISKLNPNHQEQQVSNMVGLRD